MIAAATRGVASQRRMSQVSAVVWPTQREGYPLVGGVSLHLKRCVLAFAGLLSLLLVGSGCGPGSPDYASNLRIPPGTISSSQLARELNMDVAETTPCTTMLRDGTNVVIIYPDPGGEIYVNGASFKPPAGVRCVDGTMFVPAAVVDIIRPALRSPPRPVVAVPQPAQPARPIGSPGRRSGASSSTPGTAATTPAPRASWA